MLKNSIKWNNLMLILQEYEYRFIKLIVCPTFSKKVRQDKNIAKYMINRILHENCKKGLSHFYFKNGTAKIYDFSIYSYILSHILIFIFIIRGVKYIFYTFIHLFFCNIHPYFFVILLCLLFFTYYKDWMKNETMRHIIFKIR